jgi:hypothetical protein
MLSLKLKSKEVSLFSWIQSLVRLEFEEVSNLVRLLPCRCKFWRLSFPQRSKSVNLLLLRVRMMTFLKFVKSKEWMSLFDRYSSAIDGGRSSFVMVVILFEFAVNFLRLWQSLIHVGISVSPSLLTLISFMLEMSRCLYLVYLRGDSSGRLYSPFTSSRQSLSKIYISSLFVCRISTLNLIDLTNLFSYLNTLKCLTRVGSKVCRSFLSMFTRFSTLSGRAEAS